MGISWVQVCSVVRGGVKRAQMQSPQWSVLRFLLLHLMAFFLAWRFLWCPHVQRCSVMGSSLVLR